jgi:hypothetical protein
MVYVDMYYNLLRIEYLRVSSNLLRGTSWDE